MGRGGRIETRGEVRQAKARQDKGVIISNVADTPLMSLLSELLIFFLFCLFRLCHLCLVSQRQLCVAKRALCHCQGASPHIRT